MGLRVYIARTGHDSPLNLFYGRDVVTVVNIEGPFDPTPDAPAARLERGAFGDPIIVPVDHPTNREAAGPMFGGTYAAASDSRFHQATKIYGALPIHDRYESWDMYERMSR